MRGLKILVVVMGVMLVVGVAGLVVTIAMRLAHRAPSPAAVFSAPTIILPHGSTIETMTVGSDRIVLQVDLADGSVQLIVIDLATGKQLGTIPLQEQP
ncbi:MAG TPA: DUF6476 family protein [Stellaceae bacterium]|nr:DUF6476 family protein [Stellaceae bacterium]